MSESDLCILAVGDAVPDWPDPESLFALAMPALAQADILFGQLECNLARSAERQLQAYHARRF